MEHTPYDMLFRRAFAVFILFEHKSYPDRWVALQMLRYVVATHDTTTAHIPHFEPIRANLAHLSEERFLGSVQTITGLVFLKYIKQRMTAGIARTLLEVMRRAVEDPQASELAAICYQVYVQVKERSEMELVQTLARENRYAEVREDGMTYAEELVQEGLERGELQDKQRVLIRQLAKRFGLSDPEREQIESCEDRDALDAALDEIVVTQAKEAVLAKLGSGGDRGAG